MKKINDTSSVSGGSECRTYKTLRGFSNSEEAAVMRLSDYLEIAFNPSDKNQVVYLNKYQSNPLFITHDGIVELNDSKVKHYNVSHLSMLLSEDRSAYDNF